MQHLIKILLSCDECYFIYSTLQKWFLFVMLPNLCISFEKTSLKNRNIEKITE